MTRFRKLFNIIARSSALTVLVFLIIDFTITFIQYSLSIDLTVYNKFALSFSKFFDNFSILMVNYGEHPLFNRTINMVSLILIIVGFGYGARNINKKVHAFFVSDIKRKYIFNAILAGIWLFVTIGIIADVSKTVEGIYIICGTITDFISKIFMLDIVGSAPTKSFGINIMLRAAIVGLLLYVILNGNGIWKYWFKDKVKISNGKVQQTTQGDSDGISRITRFFYDENQNKLNIKNIAELLGVFTVLGIVGIGVNDKLTNGELLNHCWNFVLTALQWSTVNSSPFSGPIPISVIVNISIRLISVAIYIFFAVYIGFSIVSTIKAMREKEYKKIFITAVALCMIILFIFLINNNAEWLVHSKNNILNVLKYVIAVGVLGGGIAWLIAKLSKSNLMQSFLTSCKNGIIYVGGNICSAAKALIDPLFNYLKKSPENQQDDDPTLTAAANVCAIASLLTTFVGLISFFRGTILTVNIPMAIISVTICLCITVGVQYSMLKLGIFLGKDIGKIFDSSRIMLNISDWKDYSFFERLLNHLKCIPERFGRIFIALLLTVVYAVPMMISSLFSFSSLFAGASYIGGYREVVNNDVWNNSFTMAKAIMEDTVSEYNRINNEIEQALDSSYNKYTNYYNTIAAWDRVNVGVDEVDGHALEFINRTNGTRSYKNTINMLLMEDRYNNYNIETKEQNVYYNNSIIYKVMGHEITSPFEIKLNPLEGDESNNESNDEQHSENGRSFGKIESSGNNGINKYQVVDILLNEYISLMNDTASSYNAAKTMKAELVSKPNAFRAIEEISDDDPLGVKEITKAYYNNVGMARRIFESYIKIRNNIVSDPQSAVDAKDFISVNQLPAAVINYALYNSDSASNGFEAEDELEESASPVPEGDSQAIKDENIMKKYVSETDFNTRMDRLISMLSYLSDIENDNTETKEPDKEEYVNKNTHTDDATKLTNTIKNINDYYNYANSRSIDLAFGLDVAYRGNDVTLPQIYLAKTLLNLKSKITTEGDEEDVLENFMNPHNEIIDDIYEQSTLAEVLMIIAFLIDMMPIIIGMFMHFLKLYQKETP